MGKVDKSQTGTKVMHGGHAEDSRWQRGRWRTDGGPTIQVRAGFIIYISTAYPIMSRVQRVDHDALLYICKFLMKLKIIYNIVPTVIFPKGKKSKTFFRK